MPCGCSKKKIANAKAVAAQLKTNKALQLKLSLIKKTVNTNNNLPSVPLK